MRGERDAGPNERDSKPSTEVSEIEFHQQRYSDYSRRDELQAVAVFTRVPGIDAVSQARTVSNLREAGEKIGYRVLLAVSGIIYIFFCLMVTI